MPTTRPGTRRIADRARRALRLAGARSTAIWPDEASLSLWALPPAQLTTTLVDLIEHGTGAAAYYADVMEAVVALAVEAPGGFGDADAWYCILEGTAEISVAEAQARAIADILAAYATAPSQDREILLAVDEFSAVSRRLPVWQLYERARSLGLAVQVSAEIAR